MVILLGLKRNYVGVAACLEGGVGPGPDAAVVLALDVLLLKTVSLLSNELCQQTTAAFRTEAMKQHKAADRR